ncbi:unnamed protein product [Parajaminaea phylloscopi]
MSGFSLRPSSATFPPPVAGPSRLPSTPSGSSGGTTTNTTHPATVTSPATADGSASSSASALCRHLFASAIPLAVTLNLADLPSGSDAALAKDLTCYVTARRSSYLPLLISQVKEQLIDLVVPDGSSVKDEELWFEYRGVPLKWHWPIGLLYDHTINNLAPTQHYDAATHVGPSTRNGYPSATDYFTQAKPPTRASVASAPVPWHITVRLRNLPHAKLPLPSSNPTTASRPGAVAHLVESAKQAFMAMLKEADFVRNGNTKKVNNLRREEQDGIWESVRTGDWGTYSTLISKLLPPASAYPMEPMPPVNAALGVSVPAASTSSTSSIPNRSSSLYSTGGNESQASLTPSLFAPSIAETILTPGASEDDNGGSMGGHAAANANAESLAAGASPMTLKGLALPGLKAIPVKFVLQGSVMLQEAIPPLNNPAPNSSSNATPVSMTLGQALHALFPALFPSSLDGNDGPAAAATLAAATSTATITPTAGDAGGQALLPLAVPIIQGIRVPLDSSMPWLSRVMSGPEGWLTIVLLLLPKGDYAL